MYTPQGDTCIFCSYTLCVFPLHNLVPGTVRLLKKRLGHSMPSVEKRRRRFCAPYFLSRKTAPGKACVGSLAVTCGRFLVFPTQTWTDNSKWALHGDMLRQYAGCVADNMPGRRNNMSVRMDVWGSLNGRFHQRLVDPDEDLLHAMWSPWSPAPWLMPLLRHLDAWRPWIEDAKDRAADDRLFFFADFPGKRHRSRPLCNNADRHIH